MKHSGIELKELSKKTLFWMILGVVAAFASMLPYFILGTDSIITYHDQLDGELITYLLNGKHLFEGLTSYPELMNGIPVNGLASPAPLFVILYSIFKPFVAFLISMAVIRLISVFSMFLLLNELTGNKPLSFVMAVLFMLLPFYTVYGLCIPGQAILYYSYLRFKKEKVEWPLYIAIAFYATASSLALCGFAILCVFGVLTIVSFAKKEKWWRDALSLVVLLAIYLAENLSLVKQILGISDGFISHKSEIVHAGNSYFDSLMYIFINGATYTEANQKFFIPICLVALVGGIIWRVRNGKSNETESRLLNVQIFLLGSIVLISMIAAFFECKTFADFANSRHGVIHDFNFSRFSWLLPVLWIMLFAASCELILRLSKKVSKQKLMRALAYFVTAASICITLCVSIYKSDLKSNIMKIVKHGDYYMLTWKQFYAEDLFDEVDRLIGEEKADYRIVSYGIYPAAAAYNGFYCLDAYSNNYDVDYKHEFREVLEPQLAKSEYLSDWYDNWGNRCYIVLKESLDYFTVEKKWGNYSTDYELNFEKLKSLGCKYIVSAVYLMNYEQNNLELLNPEEKPIETEESWYRLFVYKIK